MPREEAEPVGSGVKSSPFPGCLILVTIIVVFGGLLVLYTVVGNYQQKQIAGFTEEVAAEIEVPNPSPEEAEAAQDKLDQISASVSEGIPDRITFTAADLNALIANRPELEDFRGQTFIEGITPKGIVARMSQPMRKGFLDKSFRYLNATFVLEPELRARTIAFKVVEIQPDVGEIPRQFVDSYAVLDFFRLDPEIPAIEESIASIAAVYSEAEIIVVETKIPSEDK
ncbi:MAG: hypothetical protein AAGC68_11030 [Verrucomicrobiota bacterium]